MLHISIFIACVLLQTDCSYGQIQSPASLNLGNVIKAVQDLGSAFSGNDSTAALAGVLGLNPADPLTGVSRLMELRTQYNIGSECLEHMMAFIQAVPQGEEWAMKMLDAIGKPPSGLLQGKITWLGDYDECRDVTATSYSDAASKAGPRELFKGQYCHIDYAIKTEAFLLSAPPKFIIGVCVPDSCTNLDVQTLATIVSNITEPYLNTTLNVTLPSPSSVTCQGPTPLDTRATVAVVVCSMFLFVMTVATIYDVIYVQWLAKKQSSKAHAPTSSHQNGGFESDPGDKSTCTTAPNGQHGVNADHTGDNDVPKADLEAQRKTEYTPSTAAKLLLSFSVYTNATKILNTSQPKGALTAVNGIRFLSMSWVIVGHSYLIVAPVTDNSLQFYTDYSTRFLFIPILNGSFSVDSFFVLSGLLLTYLTLKEMKKINSALKFKWTLFYFHRIWRLTPPYMLTLMISSCLTHYLGNGPMWNPGGMDADDCKTYWWTHLLYVNNIVHSKQQCFGHSWYLANDMQFYVFSPLMIVPLFLFPVAGGIMCLLFLATSAISSGLVSAHYGLPPAFFFAQDTLNHYVYDLYYKPWCRVGPYAVGVFAGYLLYRCQLKMNIPKFVNLGTWLVASAAGALIVYGLYSDDGSNPLSDNMSNVYNAISRSIWGACVAWVIFACATGNGGPVNHILSWPGFVPLGRLSYCAYLVHPPLMYIHDMSSRKLMHAYDYSLIYLTLGHLCISYAAAFVVSLAFEAPMMGIEKVLLGRKKNS